MGKMIPVVWVKFSAKMDARNIKTASLAFCPICGGERVQRWGKIEQNNPDEENHLRITRFRCANCGRTFSDPAKQNYKQAYLDTVQAVAGMIWTLGFSLREIETLFQTLEMYVSRSSIWRYGKRMALKLDCPDLQTRQIKIDPLYIPGVSEKLGVVVGLELCDGRQVVLGAMPEHNPKIVKRYLEDLLSDAQVEVNVKGEMAVKSSEFSQVPCPFVVG
jgi:transposase-like protein